MQPQSKEWAWMDCNLTIKRASKKNQNQVFEILESEYTVHLEEDETESELNIEISMDKKINHEEEAGFIWHKSWNIPSIEVKISKRDLNAIKNQLGISRVYCEITSGYPIRKMVEFYIQEVGLDGETRKEIGNNGVARFNNLKFSETSFNHQRNKFSLIIIVFTKNEERSRSVLKSFISMPIYVDSRREARKKPPNNTFLAELIPVEAFQEELEQRHFDKKLSKPKVKQSRTEGQSERGQGKYLIKYTLAGFINYYKSANIRNKIKHPFYFSYHFSSLITLFYNRELATSPLEVLRALEKPCKHDAKKLLLVALSPSAGEVGNDLLEDLKKQFQTLFESNWKYFFIEVTVKGSLYYNFVVQEKVAGVKDEEGLKKWAEIPKQELLEAYASYYAQIQQKQNEEMKNSLDSDSVPPVDNSQENNKKYEHFELHQTIFIQAAFQGSQPTKKVKIEAREQEEEEEYDQ